MPNTRLISLNASGGAQVTITASIPCRRVEVIEDESVTPQGLIYQSIAEVAPFTTTFQVGPSTESVILGNPVAAGHGAGPLLGLPAQNGVGNFNSIAATPLFKATSATASTTKVRFVEIE